jgi:hypothetical protein
LSVESEYSPSDTLLENVSLDVMPSYHSGSIVRLAPRGHAFTAHLRFGGAVYATPEYVQIVTPAPHGDVTTDIPDVYVYRHLLKHTNDVPKTRDCFAFT